LVGGHNRLAGLLTGYELDVPEGDVAGATADEDVELTEFSDEIEEWVIENC
jgi:N utilization substance protein A